MPPDPVPRSTMPVAPLASIEPDPVLAFSGPPVSVSRRSPEPELASICEPRGALMS
jgi:hypothetical protein